MVKTNLLLIDNRVSDISTVISSVNSNTTAVVTIDYSTDTVQTIGSKIINLGISNFTTVGLFQENYENSTYKLVESFEESVLSSVSELDPELSTWTEFIGLLEYLKTTWGITNVDLMGCNIFADPNWDYVINKLKTTLSISIESSIDNK